jgi:hypothetical protein
MSINSGTTSILATIPTLSASNWYDFAKGMKMFFLGVGVDGIASGSPPSDAAELTKWQKLDRQIIAYIYAKVDPDYQYLIQDLESGAAAWKALKAHFEKSTMGHRMQARQKFYAVTHDTSKPVDFYIQALSTASRRLAAVGIKIDDTEFKDVLLMNLDSSFHPIRTTILAQKTEPTLEEVKTLLTSSTSAEVLPLSNSSSTSESLMFTQSRKKANGSGSWREGNRHSHDHSHDHGGNNSGSGGSPVDEKGFRWCNPTNEGACHRCGRIGHIAARCMFNMPQEVKDWIMASSSQNSHAAQQQANSAYHFLSSPINSPLNSPVIAPIHHAHHAQAEYPGIDFSGVGSLLL